PDEGGARQSSGGSESEASRQDQPTRLQDPGSVAKRERETRSSQISGARKSQGTQGKGRCFESESVVILHRGLSKEGTRRPPFLKKPNIDSFSPFKAWCRRWVFLARE